MKEYRKIDEKLIEKIRNAAERGFTRDEICKRLEISYDSLYRICADNNIKTRRRMPLNKHTEDFYIDRQKRVAELIEENYSRREIAEELNIDYRTVASICQTLGYVDKDLLQKKKENDKTAVETYELVESIISLLNLPVKHGKKERERKVSEVAEALNAPYKIVANVAQVSGLRKIARERNSSEEVEILKDKINKILDKGSKTYTQIAKELAKAGYVFYEDPEENEKYIRNFCYKQEIIEKKRESFSEEECIFIKEKAKEKVNNYTQITDLLNKEFDKNYSISRIWKYCKDNNIDIK